MPEKSKQSPVLGVILLILYSCVAGALLFIFIPDATVAVENSLAGTGPLAVLVVAVLLLLAFLVSMPLMLLAKTFLKRGIKPLAIACGLIIGLPVTVALVINASQELYFGAFSMASMVLFGGPAQIFTAYFAVSDPSHFVGK